ncbi:MAG: hypothetical protein K0S76_1671 [Herbinix sp.]|nr:hypothetical protein [Herbinix sp.]
MRAVIKKFALLGVIALSIGICYKVTSYSYARVQGAINISINSSEQALIAMPEEIELQVSKSINVTNTLIERENIKALKDKWEDYSEDELISTLERNIPINRTGEDGIIRDLYVDTVEDCVIYRETDIQTELGKENFYINNNLSVPATININIDELQPGETMNIIDVTSRNLGSGETWRIPFHIDKNVESTSFQLVITAFWEGGSAVINKIITVQVDTVMNEIKNDLREDHKEEIISETEHEKALSDREQTNSKEKLTSDTSSEQATQPSAKKTSASTDRTNPDDTKIASVMEPTEPEDNTLQNRDLVINNEPGDSNLLSEPVQKEDATINTDIDVEESEVLDENMDQDEDVTIENSTVIETDN